MSANLNDHRLINDFLYNWFAKRKTKDARLLWRAMEYSIFSGGKRFRPMLSLQAGHAIGVEIDRILPFAAAVELIHTYSLIHDDLPVMDDDNWRRGQPTSHILFGEDMALLAGDSLLTEAFFILGQSYRDIPDIGLRLTAELAQAAGPSGMVAGQVMDLLANESELNESQLLNLHGLKTGALISVAVKGVGILGRISEAKIQALENFGYTLGLAFQVADDLLDHKEGQAEPTGLPGLVGLSKTKEILNNLSDKALNIVRPLGETFEEFTSLIEWNRTREL